MAPPGLLPELNSASRPVGTVQMDAQGSRRAVAGLPDRGELVAPLHRRGQLVELLAREAAAGRVRSFGSGPPPFLVTALESPTDRCVGARALGTNRCRGRAVPAAVAGHRPIQRSGLAWRPAGCSRRARPYATRSSGWSRTSSALGHRSDGAAWHGDRRC